MALVLSLALALLDVGAFAPSTRLDGAWQDLLQRVTPRPARPHRTLVVDIDEASLTAVGQWPWPRYRIAALIDRIAAARPAAIALDVAFPEADRTSLANIASTYERDFGVHLSFDAVPPGLRDSDGYLGDTMARADVIAACYFYFDHATGSGTHLRPGIGFDGRLDLLALDDAPGLMMNVAPIASRTRVTGFMNSRADADGVLRRLPMVIRHDGVLYPGLALASAMRVLGTSTATVDKVRDGLVLRLRDREVPIDASGQAMLRFGGGASAFDSISAVDVLNGNLRAGDMAGRVVFVGTSAVGLNDLHDTPVDGHFPGLKLQSVMAQSILDGDAPREPSWGAAFVVASCLLVALATIAAWRRGGGPVALAVAGAAAALAAFATAVALWLGAGTIVAPAPAAVTAILLFVSLTLLRLRDERRRSRVWARRLDNARRVTIESMAAVAETRDPDTGAHIRRTQHYVRSIAQRLRDTGHHADRLTPDYIALLFASAPLHDIGKVGVPDHILLKPGPLTPAEMEIMKQHADFGARIIASAADHIDGDNFLQVASDIAGTHHERWDGKGYPRGLAGEQIPLAGRIMAVADIYDALISRRCYKPAFPHEQAMAMMRELRGTTFDPAVLDAFLAIEDTVRDIARRFSDDARRVAVVGDRSGPRGHAPIDDVFS